MGHCMTNDKMEKEKHQKSSDQYSIIEYLIRTPSVMIAAVSGIIAVCAFLVEMASFLYEVKELDYWNIEWSILQEKSQPLFYYFLFALFLSATTLIVSLVIRKSFQCYAPYSAILGYLKRRIKNCKKTIRTVARLTHRKLKKANDDSQECSKLDGSESELKKEKAELSALSKTVRKMRRYYLTDLVAHIVLSGAIVWIVYSFICRMFENDGYIPYYIFACGATVIHMGLYCLFEWIRMIIRARKDRKRLESKELSIEIAMENAGLSEYPIQNLAINGVKKNLSNSAIINALVSTLLSFIIAIAIMSFPFLYRPKRTMKCVMLDNIQYVAVYSTSTIMVLEEAHIMGNTVKINTARQRVVPLSDVSYEMRRFVDILKTDGAE